MKEHEKPLKALANKRRLEILSFLKKEREATVGDIAEEIKLSFKATSKHLGILKAANLVEHEQRSLAYFYRLGSSLPLAGQAIIKLL
ncbi:MAG: winged helix-turn-helix transcriptional regulator [Candidatus Vogelbacteria bacterium]|nr:winged helix-turn-helix transcriptional regulator [Candidatus Vogelbacteria bacterium]